MTDTDRNETQIFISHSKDDDELIQAINEIFGNSSIRQHRASFERHSTPISGDLKKEINESSGLFVVLGRNAQIRQHTMIWIGWEVGIATQLEIPVWIMEDVNSQLENPIPSFTDYVLWDSREEDHRRKLRNIIETKFIDEQIERPDHDLILEKGSGNVFGNVRNFARPIGPSIADSPKVATCPWESCGENFRIRFNDIQSFNCPACRKQISISTRF